MNADDLLDQVLIAGMRTEMARRGGAIIDGIKGDAACVFGRDGEVALMVYETPPGGIQAGACVLTPAAARAVAAALIAAADEIEPAP